jgi:hypothetical protein
MLDIAITASIFAGFAYTLFAFAEYSARRASAAVRPVAAPAPAAPTVEPIAEPALTPKPEQHRRAAAAMPVAVCTVEIEKIAPAVTEPSDWDGMTRDELRAACKEAGIRWNRAGKDGKHLTKEEMIAALFAKRHAVRVHAAA